MYAIDRGNLIESMVITEHRLDVFVNKHFKKKYLNDDFFVEYQDDIDLTKLDRSLLILPFIMNVFSTICISGDTYYIDTIDADTYRSLQNLNNLYKVLFPRTTWNGKLIAKNVVINRPENKKIEQNKDHIAIMFSGGLDSVHTSLMHEAGKQLLITAWGQPDLKWYQLERWQRAKQLFQSFASQRNQTHTFFRSNHHTFLNYTVLDNLTPEIKRWWMYAILGPCWAGLAAPIVVTHGYSILFVSSAVTWDYPYLYGTCPVVDDAICFAGIKLRHYGFDKTRTQKCDDIQKQCKVNDISLPILRICPGFDYTNCCLCEKCMRTMAEILVSGGDLVSFGFNIDRTYAVARIKKNFVYDLILKGKKNYTSVWFCQQIQKNLESRFSSHKEELSDLKWLLDINFEPIAKQKSKTKIKVNWRKLYKETEYSRCV